MKRLNLVYYKSKQRLSQLIYTYLYFYFSELNATARRLNINTKTFIVNITAG
jgi:hypothetical protein